MILQRRLASSQAQLPVTSAKSFDSTNPGTWPNVHPAKLPTPILAKSTDQLLMYSIKTIPHHFPPFISHIFLRTSRGGINGALDSYHVVATSKLSSEDEDNRRVIESLMSYCKSLQHRVMVSSCPFQPQVRSGHHLYCAIVGAGDDACVAFPQQSTSAIQVCNHSRSIRRHCHGHGDFEALSPRRADPVRAGPSRRDWRTASHGRSSEHGCLHDEQHYGRHRQEAAGAEAALPLSRPAGGEGEGRHQDTRLGSCTGDYGRLSCFLAALAAHLSVVLLRSEHSRLHTAPAKGRVSPQPPPLALGPLPPRGAAAGHAALAAGS